MMAISKEHVARYESEHRNRDPGLATYARLEWGGHTGWLRALALRTDRPRLRILKLQGWARILRLPRPETMARTPAVLLDRVRIPDGLEILISVGLPDTGVSGPLEVSRPGEDSVEPELAIAL